MLFYLIQIIISFIAVYYYGDNRLRYFSMITAAYFISYYASGSFDIALTLYCAFVVLGVGKPSSFESMDFFLFSWVMVYFVIGVLFKSAYSTMAAFVTRYGFVVLWLWIYNIKPKEKEWVATVDDYRFAIRVGFLTELMIIILIWATDGIGARVVKDNQPIGAGMATALMTIIGWCYLNKQFSVKETMLYTVFCTITILLSGTRGYMVIYALAMVVIFSMYLLDTPENGKRSLQRVGIFLVILSLLVLYVFFVKPDILVDVLRLDEGLGYRENENVYVKEIMKIAPWHNRLLGFGMSGTANHVEGFLEVVYQASWNRKWMIERLLNKSIFHNYWYTILFKQGVVGLVFIVVFFLRTIKTVLKLNTSLWFRSLLALLIIGNMISQTYRITATCSVFEMLLIMFFVKQIESRDALAEKDCHL